MRGHPKTVGCREPTGRGELKGIYRKSQPGAVSHFTSRGSHIRLAKAWRDLDRKTPEHE